MWELAAASRESVALIVEDDVDFLPGYLHRKTNVDNLIECPRSKRVLLSRFASLEQFQQSASADARGSGGTRQLGIDTTSRLGVLGSPSDETRFAAAFAHVRKCTLPSMSFLVSRLWCS